MSKTERSATSAPAVGDQVERGVGRLVPDRTDVAPRCCYCCKPAPGWTAAEAATGKRWAAGALQYHCYTGYCWD